jgi:hypothetical protein
MAVVDGTLATGGIGLVGASVCYDLVLLRVCRHLEAHEPESALDTVRRALSVRTEPALNLYYPALCFLQAGVQAVAGEVGQASETLEWVGASTVANDVEVSVATLFRADTDAARLRARIKSDRVGRFWYAWLYSASRIGAGESSVGVEKALEQLSELSVSRRQKRLADALRAYHAGRR